MENNLKTTERDFSYIELQIIREHAKKYDSTPDKKNFLKSITPYEQKLVLLESKNPYEVLQYLEEIDQFNTKTVLNQLSIDEISQIYNLFSKEDKEKFYETFSYLPLVNQFITFDKKADEYIDDMSFDRKVELLDSSNSKTVSASEKVIESMSTVEQDIAENKLTTAGGVSALSSVSVSESDIQTELLDDNKEPSDIKMETKVEDENRIEPKVEELEIKEEENPEIKNEENKKAEETKNDNFELREPIDKVTDEIFNSEILNQFKKVSSAKENQEIEQIKLIVAENTLENDVKTM